MRRKLTALAASALPLVKLRDRMRPLIGAPNGRSPAREEFIRWPPSPSIKIAAFAPPIQAASPGALRPRRRNPSCGIAAT
jgi:hypothetical protein